MEMAVPAAAPVAMDVDNDAPATATPPSAAATANPTNLTPSDTNDSSQLLRALGAAADHPQRFDASAPPAAASLSWRPGPDGNVALEPAGAAMVDVDDPKEDDVDTLQPDDYEYDDDVSAVGGDILGVGPTWGTVAGVPTSTLGGLGAELDQQLLDSTTPGGAAAAAAAGGGGGGVGGSSGGGGGKRQKQHGAGYSEGDADVRGRVVAGVREDAEYPIRPGAAAAAAGAATAAAAGEAQSGDLAGGRECGQAGVGDEYSPEGLDALDAGAIADGDFVSQPYLRSRSAGQAGIDPDPRLRPEPDARRGLGLEGAGLGTSHPVHKDDFGMGTLAVPAFGENGSSVRGLEYTDEPKYAAEVAAAIPAELGGMEADDDAAREQGLGEEGLGGLGGDGLGGRSLGGGSGGAAGVDDVGRVAGSAGVEGSGPVLMQQVGTQGLGQVGIAEATAAQPTAATDARHLGAIFGDDPFAA